MPRTVHFQLSGRAQQFVEEMEREGLSERDVFAKALGLLREVYKTRRIGLISHGYEESDAVEFIYGINVSNAKSKRANLGKPVPETYTATAAATGQSYYAAEEAVSSEFVELEPIDGMRTEE